MAQRQKNKKPKVAEAERDEQPVAEPTEDALAPSSDAPTSDQDDDEADERAEGTDDGASIDGEDKAAAGESAALARVEDDAEGEEEEEGSSAAQLGSERYVLAGFFAAAMLLAYVLGRAIQTTWATLSNKAWFSQSLPRLAAVPDDDKSTYGLVLGAVIAVIVIVRAYRRPDIRTWTDEVASELAKVKWPDRKEVQSSTIIVIVATTMATLYMAVLDRFWAFVTNIVYGDGS